MRFLRQTRFEFADLGRGAVGGGVEGLDGAHKDLAGGKRAEDGDAEAPVVAKWRDHGFDGVAHRTEDAGFKALCRSHGLTLLKGA